MKQDGRQSLSVRAQRFFVWSLSVVALATSSKLSGEHYGLNRNPARDRNNLSGLRRVSVKASDELDKSRYRPQRGV